MFWPIFKLSRIAGLERAQAIGRPCEFQVHSPIWPIPWPILGRLLVLEPVGRCVGLAQALLQTIAVAGLIGLGPM